MPVLTLRLVALAALTISVSGCVVETYGSHACSDAQSWIGLPIQDVTKRFGKPEHVTGDAARQRCVWEEYENYNHDYDCTYYEQGHGNTLNSSILSQKAGTADQSDCYTYIYGFFADAPGRVVNATAWGEYRQLQAPFTPQRAIGSTSHRLVPDIAETPKSNAETSPPFAPL